MNIKKAMHRATLSINLGFLEDNLNKVRSVLSEGVRVLCVVKADAYGHGAVEVARRLETIKVDYLGVATIDEAMELRKEGISSPLLVMSGVMPWESVSGFYENNLTPVVYDMGMLQRIVEDSKNLSTPIRIHVKVDTGMGRLGFDIEKMPYIVETLLDAKNVYVEGLMSHFSSSEVRDDYGLEQINNFKSIIQLFTDTGIEPDFLHMANSGAILNYPEAHFNMVRLGIGLYGSYSERALSNRLPLKQVMRLSSRIALLREFPPERSLSYGRTFKTERESKIAYIPLGYSDGYPRALSNRGFVLIKGIRCGIVGRVCMDWILVDVTDHRDIDVGDEVILIGYDGNECITADEIAEHEGTIPYEILCKTSKRIPRIYIN